MATPKTGQAKSMREWMRNMDRAFTTRRMCNELGIPRGRERERARNTLCDFQGRGEVERTPTGMFRYNHAWRRGSTAPLKARILKAMYVSVSAFSLSEIRVRAEAPDRGYVHRIARVLREGEYIVQVGRRTCAHGAGAERIFNIVNRERFRVEVMR